MSDAPLNRFATITLLIGIPGAGKTTWVKEYKKKHPTIFIVSTDEIREKLFGTIICDPLQNEEVYNEAIKEVKEIMDIPVKTGFGPEIIIDSTNVDINLWRRYKDLNPYLMFARIFLTPPEEAEKRMEKRSYKVSKEIINEKWNELQKNLKYLKFFFNIIIPHEN